MSGACSTSVEAEDAKGTGSVDGLEAAENDMAGLDRGMVGWACLCDDIR